MNLKKTRLNPLLKEGNNSNDDRGILFHNNDFDLSPIRRVYTIENKSKYYFRGWKGHKIENRWFTCVKGKIRVYLTSIENLENRINKYQYFELNENKMDVLFVPAGHATLIKQITANSRIMAFSDWLIGESNDENLRWPNDIFQL